MRISDWSSDVCSSDLSTFSPVPVATQTAKKRPIKVHFYFDIRAALDPDVARSDAVIAVPEDRIIRENFGRDVKLDLSCEEHEFEALYFPIDRIFDENRSEEHTSELQSLMRISYAVFCLKKK